MNNMLWPIIITNNKIHVSFDDNMLLKLKRLGYFKKNMH